MGLNTQGILAYNKDESSTDYLRVGCIQKIGDIDLGKRSSKEDGCMDKETMGKVIGALKFGSMQIGYKYDPTEPLGHGSLATAHTATPAPVQNFRIELPNKLTDDGHGTYFDFEVYVTERSISVPVDDDMETSVTLEMISAPVVTAAE